MSPRRDGPELGRRGLPHVIAEGAAGLRSGGTETGRHWDDVKQGEQALGWDREELGRIHLENLTV